MPRDYSASENAKRARARRDSAMARNELRQPSSPRTPAKGATSMALKVADPTDARLIEAYLAQKQRDKQ